MSLFGGVMTALNFGAVYPECNWEELAALSQQYAARAAVLGGLQSRAESLLVGGVSEVLEGEAGDAFAESARRLLRGGSSWETIVEAVAGYGKYIDENATALRVTAYSMMLQAIATCEQIVRAALALAATPFGDIELPAVVAVILAWGREMVDKLSIDLGEVLAGNAARFALVHGTLDVVEKFGLDEADSLLRRMLRAGLTGAVFGGAPQLLATGSINPEQMIESMAGFMAGDAAGSLVGGKVGSLLNDAWRTPVGLVAGRFATGLAAGAASTTAMIATSELAALAATGRLSSVDPMQFVQGAVFGLTGGVHGLGELPGRDVASFAETRRDVGHDGTAEFPVEPGTFAEARSVYRKIAGLLHPDVTSHAGLSLQDKAARDDAMQQASKLYQDASDAHRNGTPPDLGPLKRILDSYSALAGNTEPATTTQAAPTTTTPPPAPVSRTRPSNDLTNPDLLPATTAPGPTTGFTESAAPPENTSTMTGSTLAAAQAGNNLPEAGPLTNLGVEPMVTTSTMAGPPNSDGPAPAYLPTSTTSETSTRPCFATNTTLPAPATPGPEGHGGRTTVTTNLSMQTATTVTPVDDGPERRPGIAAAAPAGSSGGFDRARREMSWVTVGDSPQGFARALPTVQKGILRRPGLSSEIDVPLDLGHPNSSRSDELPTSGRPHIHEGAGGFDDCLASVSRHTAVDGDASVASYNRSTASGSTGVHQVWANQCGPELLGVHGVPETVRAALDREWIGLHGMPMQDIVRMADADPRQVGAFPVGRGPDRPHQPVVDAFRELARQRAREGHAVNGMSMLVFHETPFPVEDAARGREDQGAMGHGLRFRIVGDDAETAEIWVQDPVHGIDAPYDSLVGKARALVDAVADPETSPDLWSVAFTPGSYGERHAIDWPGDCPWSPTRPSPADLRKPIARHNPEEGPENTAAPGDTTPVGAERVDAVLCERARQVAQVNGTTADIEIMKWVQQRAIARLFAAEPGPWALRGPLALQARVPGRPVTRVEVGCSDEATPEQLAQRFHTALQRDHGDHLQFQQIDSELLPQGTGIRVSHRVVLGDATVMDMSTDLFATAGVGGSSRETEQQMFADGQLLVFPGDPDEITVVSREVLLAGMLAEVVSAGGWEPKHGADLLDVVVCALNFEWDAPRIRALLAQELATRGVEGADTASLLELPRPGSKAMGEFGRLAKVTPRVSFTRLTEAEELLKAFLTPLVSPDAAPDGSYSWSLEDMCWLHNGTGAAVSPPAGPLIGSLVQGVRLPVGEAEIDPYETFIWPATGNAPASEHFATPQQQQHWDRLFGLTDSGDDETVQEFVDRVARDQSPLDQKLRAVQEFMAQAAGPPTLVRDRDDRHFRFYSDGDGDVFPHAAAGRINPETTLEIGYHRDVVYKSYASEAKALGVRYDGVLPEGMTRDQVDAVAVWRRQRNKPIDNVAEYDLVHDLLTMQVGPLVGALDKRNTFIHQFGYAPERVQIAYAGVSKKNDPHHRDQAPETHYIRSNVIAVNGIREDPEGALNRMIAGVLGTGEEARRRLANAQAVISALDAKARELNRSPQKIALLWVRDGRINPVAKRNGLDTQPAFLRQTIEAVKTQDPDRHIVLVGDDVFRHRPGLREAWTADGLLKGVDAETLIRFWKGTHTNGHAMGLGEQELVYHLLHRQRDVIQAGTLSGAWKGLVMAGIPAVWLNNKPAFAGGKERWTLDYSPWAVGPVTTVRRADGSPLLDPSGHPVQCFGPDSRRLPPVPITSVPVDYRPGTAPSTDGQGAVKDYPYERVSLATERLYRLVLPDQQGRRELDRWKTRLGFDTASSSDVAAAWTDQQWTKSRYYAEQSFRWIYTEATPETVYDKWDGIRLAVGGILDPDFATDPEVSHHTPVGPYYLLRTKNPAPEDVLQPLLDAYDHRDPEAIVAALLMVFGNEQLQRRAVHDELLCGLSETENANLVAAVRHVSTAEKIELDDRDLQALVDRQVKPAIMVDRAGNPLQPVDNPELHVIGGGVAAGKSTLVNRIRENLSARGGVAAVQVDELEKLVPGYAELHTINDFTAHDKLQPMAQQVRGILEKFLIPSPYNVLLESANTNPEKTLDRMKRYAENRSATHLEVLAVQLEQARLSKTERLVNGRETDGHGRFVSEWDFLKSHDGTPELVRLIESEFPIPVDSLRIRTRTDILFENHKISDEQWSEPPQGWEILQQEQHREPTPEERRAFQARLDALSEMVYSRLEEDPARWAPVAAEIEQLRSIAGPWLSPP